MTRDFTAADGLRPDWRGRTGPAALMLTALLAAAGCNPMEAGSSTTPVEVERSDRMSEAKDWSKDLPRIYPGLMACLAAHPQQPAYAGGVVLKEGGLIEVYSVGADNSVFDCTVAAKGGTPTSNQPDSGTTLKGPNFYPEGHIGPVTACTSQDKEPVFSTDRRFLGWLSWPTC